VNHSVQSVEVNNPRRRDVENKLQKIFVETLWIEEQRAMNM
jgi:hypothetical protein